MRKNLSVLLLYNSSNEIRGKMRRYLYEVKANVFVGTISAGVRDILWDLLKSSKSEASMIIHTTSEQGFEYRTTKKDSSYTFEDFDGIILPTTIKSNITINELYAKPDYLLLDHLLDVGYIAEGLMRYGRAVPIVNSICDMTGFDTETIISSISWICALHDIGKVHPHFVGKMYPNYENLIDLYESLKDKGLVKDGDYNLFRHERYSRDILKNYFKDLGYSINLLDFTNIVAYHHQGKHDTDFANSITCDNNDWISLQLEIIDVINKIWKFNYNFIDSIYTNKVVNVVLYSILSILVTADWIASGTKWRTMIALNPDKQDCAKQFIERNELKYIPMKDRFKDVHWKDAFDFDKNELQSTIIEAVKDNPQVMIVEYPCGGGKTEAALAAAIKMGYDKSGIYLATPTMSTAKNMSIRMNELSQKTGLNLIIPEFDSSILWSDEDMNKIPKELWVSKSRHKMLYPFAVGTIDQILKTMLYHRYGCIGLMGLSDKVLIIDEVHAYDSYMLSEIKKLLKWAKYLKIPVVLLSATLPTLTKLELLRSIGYTETTLENSDKYPLITTYSNNIGYNSYPINSTGRKFKFNIIETDDYKNTWDIEMNKNVNNGCTAYIEGTVDNVWRLYNTAKSLSKNPYMFNGRDTLANKEAKTIDLVSKLGKDRSNRPTNMTLTATAIIEQSLDIDLDRMVTCIAPIDLLIQRFGRVWRHSDVGTIREHENIEIPITIIVPKSVSEYPNIYDNNILIKTLNTIKSMSEIDTIADIRYLIDSVYCSIDTIKKLNQDIRASYNCIPDPHRNAMFNNDSIAYNNFKPIQNATRYETYPTVSIAIVNDDDIDGINDNYNKIKKIQNHNVISISSYMATKIDAKPITFTHRLISDINFYMEDDLKKQNIFLTSEGLKWINN